MAEEYNKCPKCYNYIDEFNIDKTKIHRVRGELGLDENGDPLPFWSDDPVFTPLGLSGDDYKGITIPKPIHITELQDYYKGLEETILDEENRTVFLEIEAKNLIRHFNIEQLRISIENLLNKQGLTLEDYFKYDRQGNEVETTQTDWTDVNRIDKTDLPIEGEEGYLDYGYIASDTVPLLTKPINIRAIHIEELRIGIKYIWKETWEVSEQGLYTNFNQNLGGVGYDMINFLKSDPFQGNASDWRLGLGRFYSSGSSSNVLGKHILSVIPDTEYGNALKLEQELKCITLGASYPYANCWTRLRTVGNINLLIKSVTVLSFDITNFSIIGAMVMYNLHYSKFAIVVKTNYKDLIYAIHSYSEDGSYNPKQIFPFGLTYDELGICVSWNEFQNFNRNLYNDYQLFYSEIPPEDLTINYLYLSSYSYLRSTAEGDNTSINLEIDNITLN